MTDNSQLGLNYDKYAGILLHPTSLPSPYGIGDLGKGAYDFIDFMNRSGLNLWQVLPLGHTGFGDSPYQPFSSFAGQPLIISIDELRSANLLWDEDFYDMPEWDPHHVEYGEVITFKTGLLKQAYKRFKDDKIHDGYSTNEEFLKEYEAFREESDWLDDYALFMAGKDYHEGMPWYMWEDSLKKPTPKQYKAWMEKLADEVDYYRFIQFLFHKQWMAIRDYAHEKGIKIVCDMPIFVA